MSTLNHFNNDNLFEKTISIISPTPLTNCFDSPYSLSPDNKSKIRVAKNQKKKQVTGFHIKRLYYCQRCLNHNQRMLRKGHKKFCRFADCECPKCSMVSKRRYLNSKLQKKLIDKDLLISESPKKNLSKERVPTCALCAVHGCKILLRGHRKIDCPYYECRCELCVIIVHRRNLMAKQIKLRRLQSNIKNIEKDKKKFANLEKNNGDSRKLNDFSFATLPKYVEFQSNFKQKDDIKSITTVANQNIQSNFTQVEQNILPLSNNITNLSTNSPCLKLFDDNTINSNIVFSSSLNTFPQFDVKNLEKTLQNQVKSNNLVINSPISNLQQNPLSSLLLMDTIKQMYGDNITQNFPTSQMLLNTMNFWPMVSDLFQQTTNPCFGNLPQIFSQPMNIQNQDIQSNFNFLNYQNNFLLNSGQLDIANIIMQQNFSPFGI